MKKSWLKSRSDIGGSFGVSSKFNCSGGSFGVSSQSFGSGVSLLKFKNKTKLFRTFSSERNKGINVSELTLKKKNPYNISKEWYLKKFGIVLSHDEYINNLTCLHSEQPQKKKLLFKNNRLRLFKSAFARIFASFSCTALGIWIAPYILAFISYCSGIDPQTVSSITGLTAVTGGTLGVLSSLFCSPCLEDISFNDKLDLEDKLSYKSLDYLNQNQLSKLTSLEDIDNISFNKHKLGVGDEPSSKSIDNLNKNNLFNFSDQDNGEQYPYLGGDKSNNPSGVNTSDNSGGNSPGDSDNSGGNSPGDSGDPRDPRDPRDFENTTNIIGDNSELDDSENVENSRANSADYPPNSESASEGELSVDLNSLINDEDYDSGMGENDDLKPLSSPESYSGSSSGSVGLNFEARNNPFIDAQGRGIHDIESGSLTNPGAFDVAVAHKGASSKTIDLVEDYNDVQRDRETEILSASNQINSNQAYIDNNNSLDRYQIKRIEEENARLREDIIEQGRAGAYSRLDLIRDVKWESGLSLDNTGLINNNDSQEELNGSSNTGNPSFKRNRSDSVDESLEPDFKKTKLESQGNNSANDDENANDCENSGNNGEHRGLDRDRSCSPHDDLYTDDSKKNQNNKF